MLKRIVIAPVLVLILLTFAPPARAGDAATYQDERHLINLVNRDRKAKHLKPLAIDKTLTNIARRQAERMAADGEVHHNEWLFSDEGQEYLHNPKATGENVAGGGGPKAVHEGFMRSKPHRANILRSAFTKIGVGVVRSDGGIWVSEVFIRPRSGSRSGVAAPAASRAGRSRTGSELQLVDPKALQRVDPGPHSSSGSTAIVPARGFWAGPVPLTLLGAGIFLVWLARSAGGRSRSLRAHRAW